MTLLKVVNVQSPACPYLSAVSALIKDMPFLNCIAMSKTIRAAFLFSDCEKVTLFSTASFTDFNNLSTYFSHSNVADSNLTPSISL